MKDGWREGGRVEEAWYARAVVWMRGLGFDPKSETEIEGTRRSRDCREGAGGREGGTVERRGEERSAGGRERQEGWTGWIRRLAAIDFSRQTRGLFVPLLVLVLPPSVPLSLPLSLFPWRSRPAYPAPRHLRPSHSRSLARSLPLCSLAR